MSRSTNTRRESSIVRNVVLAGAAVAALIAPSTGRAQGALGVPLNGPNNLSFYSAELTRDGGSETTTLFGLMYARRLGAPDQAMRWSLQFRGAVRPSEDEQKGIADLAAAIAVSHDLAAVPGLSVAASVGGTVQAWAEDGENTGRARVMAPASAGISYDLRLGKVTLSPFTMATIARYDLRSYENDVKVSMERGWDAYYQTGATIRLRDVAVTISDISGEVGMPKRSRWALSAGIAF